MESTETHSGGRLTIKEWCVQERPREKYLAHGSALLTDAELLAILIRTGNRQESAVALSRRLLAQFGNSLNCLSKKTFKEISTVRGIGTVKAITLLAAFELGRRLGAEKVELKRKITSSTDVADLMMNKLGHIQHEEFWVLFLDTSNHLIKTSQISRGGLTNTVVDVRVLLRLALEENATAMVLCHNHPSGSVLPSKADKDVTRKVMNAAHTMDIKLTDHVIVSDGSYFSFVEHGLL